MRIWVNCIVHNEENFIWFAIMSVIDYVDKILIWDTGSTDNTVAIINEIIKEKGSKIEFREVGLTDNNRFTKMRQEMLEQSKCDWLMILDGDEIWWESSIKKVTEEIKKNGTKINGVVVPFLVPVGDIFHIQDKTAGKYKLLGREGHISLRFINKKIKGLHADWPYGKEGFFDGEKKLVQDLENIIYIEAPYLHATHLERSSNNRGLNKYKFELGKRVDKNFKYPEVMQLSFPKIVRTPWINLRGINLLKARILTPIRKIKRKII